MTSWIAGPLQQLMRSSPFPWMNLVVLMKFLVIRDNNSNNHGKSNYSSKPWQQRKAMANLGRTGTTNNGKIEIISCGKTRIKSHGKTIKAKSDKPHDTCFTLSQDQEILCSSRL